MRVTRGDQRRVSVLEQLLSEQRHAELEEFVTQGLQNDLLGDGLLSAARALRSTKVVIFLATLGVVNLPHPDDHAMWLVCYQSLAQGAESEGLQTLPDHLPVKWVVRQVLGVDTPLAPASQCQAIDWVDGLELAIDQARLDLLEHMVNHLATQGLPTQTWLALAKTLIDRENLLRYQPDLVYYARSLAVLLQQLPEDEETKSVRSTLAAHAGRCFLEVNEPEQAKAMAVEIEGAGPLYDHERAICMAEACCRANEMVESIGWMDRALELLMTPELQDELRIRHQKRKANKNAKPAFDPDTAANALTALQAALATCGHKVFLVSGTLLGYAREGRLLGHDKDIDVGIMGWINQFDVVNAILQSRQFYVETTTLGKENAHIIPIQHIETKTSIDVFLYRPEGGKLVTGVNSRFGYLQKFAFTPFELQVIEFLGVTLYAPADIDLNLRENYGDNWRVPDPDYLSHLESPSTVDVGGLVYQIVGRLNLYGAIARGKTQKLLRALNLLERERHRPGGMSEALLAKLRELSTRLDDILAYEPEPEHDSASALAL